MRVHFSHLIFLLQGDNMRKGIDISSHNGKIDMSKLKNSDIEFIILRMGYGKEKSQIDKLFFENYYKSKQFCIPVGIYLYSYALNTEDAIQESKFVLDTVKGLTLEYPIFFDMEDADGYKAKRNVNYNDCINICEAFCENIEDAGYYVGIYANLDWLNNKLNSNKLDKYDKWVAQWSDCCTYKKEYGMWQYSSKGNISGINGYVDLNYSIKDYPSIIKKANLNNYSFLNEFYIVQAGDTLTKIAKKYNTTWETIYELNKKIIGNNPNLIKIGQKLQIREV